MAEMKLLEVMHDLISETNLGDVDITFSEPRTKGILLVLKVDVELTDFSHFWPMRGEVAIDLVNESVYVNIDQWDPKGLIPTVMTATTVAQLPEAQACGSEFVRDLAALKWKELKLQDKTRRN